MVHKWHAHFCFLAMMNQPSSEFKQSLTFRVQRYAVIAIKSAPIANPPNSAQLESTPTIPPSYIQVCAVVWECLEGQTDT